jgi:hypothetical protein
VGLPHRITLTLVWLPIMPRPMPPFLLICNTSREKSRMHNKSTSGHKNADVGLPHRITLTLVWLPIMPRLRRDDKGLSSIVELPRKVAAAPVSGRPANKIHKTIMFIAFQFYRYVGFAYIQSDAYKLGLWKELNSSLLM